MPIDLDAETRRKIFRQHRDLRRILAATMAVTTDAGCGHGHRFPLLVALGLRLQRMLERHAAFEETALRAHAISEDEARIEALANDHRRQRVELSLLTKLAFGEARIERIRLAFCLLSEHIIKQMDLEESDLLGARAPASGPTRPASASRDRPGRTAAL